MAIANRFGKLGLCKLVAASEADGKEKEFLSKYGDQIALYQAGDAFGFAGLIAKDKGAARRTLTIRCGQSDGALLLRLSREAFIDCFARGP